MLLIEILFLAWILIHSKQIRSPYLFEGKRMRRCDESIKKSLKLIESMLDLADEGDAVREDSGCGVLYGVLRDSAYKIKRLAESEREAHIKKGWWK